LSRINTYGPRVRRISPVGKEKVHGGNDLPKRNITYKNVRTKQCSKCFILFSRVFRNKNIAQYNKSVKLAVSDGNIMPMTGIHVMRVHG